MSLAALNGPSTLRAYSEPLLTETNLELVKKIVPTGVEASLWQKILMHSSAINFDGTGESLFKVGDKPLGFYWVLSGRVKMEMDKGKPLVFTSGSMAGLSHFLKDQRHQQHLYTGSRAVRSLFIDQKCFQLFKTNQALQELVKNEQKHFQEVFPNQLSDY